MKTNIYWERRWENHNAREQEKERAKESAKIDNNDTNIAEVKKMWDKWLLVRCAKLLQAKYISKSERATSNKIRKKKKNTKK